MAEFPDKSKEETPVPKRDIKPVIPAVAKQVKRPATKRFMNFLLAESPKAMGARIGKDIIVPRIKQGIEEAFNSFVHGLFWGEGGSPLPPNVRGTVLRAGGTNYREISSGGPSALTQARQANSARSSGNYEDLIVPTQQFAETLLANLYQSFNRYNVVAVADLYEMASITPAPSDEAYGWYSLDGARISKVREGFVLELPRPQLIG